MTTFVSGWPLTATVYHPEKSVILDCTIGEACTIHAPVWIGNGVVIGDSTRVQAFAFIPQGVTIGSGCFIGPGVTFTNDRHPPSLDWEETTVETGVSIGANSTILPGVTIGAGAVIGAGSLITHDVAPGATVYGVW
jgi:acetyltransferase-like isoleucine patch superfamily enzyme